MYIAAIEKVVTEYAGCTIRDLQQLTEVSDLHKSVVDAVDDAVRNITRIEDDLRANINTAQRDLRTAVAQLDAGYAINPCGILQNTSREIDMLAARRADAYTRLTAACRAAAALPCR